MASTWPEQDACEEWWLEHRRELKEAVTKARLELQRENAELRERVARLEGAAQKAEEYLSANISLMYQRHDYLIPLDGFGLPEEKLRNELRAVLPQAKPAEPAKPKSQEEE